MKPSKTHCQQQEKLQAIPKLGVVAKCLQPTFIEASTKERAVVYKWDVGLSERGKEAFVQAAVYREEIFNCEKRGVAATDGLQCFWQNYNANEILC